MNFSRFAALLVSLSFIAPSLAVQAFETQNLKQKVSNVGSRFNPADQKYRNCKKSKTDIKTCTASYKIDLVSACNGLSGVRLTACLTTAESKKRGAQLNNWLSK
jgi:hypothetical protein